MTMWGSWLLWCILPPLPPKSCRLLPPPLLLSSLHHINLYLLALHQFASNFSLSPCSLSTFPPSHSSLSTSLYHPTLYQHVPYRLAHSSLSSCLPPCSYHVPYHIHPYQLLYHLVSLSTCPLSHSCLSNALYAFVKFIYLRQLLPLNLSLSHLSIPPALTDRNV